MPDTEDYVKETAEATTSETPEGTDTSHDDGKPSDKTTKTHSEPDYQKMFLDTKEAFTKASMEKAELMGRLKALEETQAAKPAEPDWLEQIDTNALKEDPVAMRDALIKLRGEVANALRMRDDMYESRLKTLDPSIVAMKDKIAELKQDTDYQGFSDAQLAVIAKKGNKKSETHTPQGGVGGGRRAATSASSDDDVKQSPLFKAIYGDILT